MSRTVTPVEGAKPCPFCGGPAELQIEYVTFDGAEVGCVDCGATAGHFEDDPGGTTALEHWNKRHG